MINENKAYIGKNKEKTTRSKFIRVIKNQKWQEKQIQIWNEIRVKDLNKTRSKGEHTCGSEETEAEKEDVRAKRGNRRPLSVFRLSLSRLQRREGEIENGEKEGMDEGRRK